MSDDAKTLPQLNPLLKLYPASPRVDGQPQWTLYHPITNQFYKIGWAEFECLSRFHKYKTIDELIQSVNAQTPLEIDEEDVQGVVEFLMMNGLIDGKLSRNMAPEGKSFLNKMAHGYLYFTYPLLRPQKFLDKTVDYIRPVFSPLCHTVMMIILAVSIVITIPRADEFFASFMSIFTFEGIILSTFILFSIKIIHEFAHAYMAKIHGVAVPHMGIAFIVLYPVFYTEATGAWRLTDRRARMQIGLAGVRFELYLAAIALIVWHFTDAGLAQMVCFTIVMISLVGSLLINLNPLMRFDGYYVLSDYLNIENLHATAIDYARHHLRKTVLGLIDDAPYDYDVVIARNLTWFGYAVMVYRFFLFLGIAILVYAVFMKPLGLIAMILELAWFIGLPIQKELKVWWERRGDYMGNKRFFISVACLIVALIYLCLPVQSTYSYPAMLHARDYQVAYAPAPAIIDEIHVQNGQEVAIGDVLITMKSMQLSQDIAKAEANIKALKTLQRRDQTNIELYREKRSGIALEIETAEKTLVNLQSKQDDLDIISKYDGVVSDLNPSINEGQGVTVNNVLLRVIKPDDFIVSVYSGSAKDESEMTNGVFRPAHYLWGGYDVAFENQDDIAVNTIRFPSLASVHAGEIPTQKNDGGDVIPLNTTYLSRFKVMDDINFQTVVAGHVIVKGEARSFLFDKVPEWFTVARQELSLN